MQLNCDTKQIKGHIAFDHPMARLNTWRVGGNAECFFEPNDEGDLSFFLSQCVVDQAITFLGLGSNMLIRDGGINGIVITLRKGFKSIEMTSQSSVRVGAGVACGTLARYCLKHHLQGLSFMAGIPGTVGGALRMNAGAFGHSTWDCVHTAETIDDQGETHRYLKDQIKTDYRYTELPAKQWFIFAEFELSQADTNIDQRSEINQLLEQRNVSQPIDTLNCGSVFKNPSNAYAAELIEKCNLKGYSIGDAQVSTKHANFIVNKGNASAKDIEALISYVKETVNQKTKIKLEEEVVIVGEPI